MAGGLCSLTVVVVLLLGFFVQHICTIVTLVVVERHEFTLSLRIPLTSDVLKHMIIVIGIDHHDKKRAISDVMYVYPQDNFTFKCQTFFEQRMQVSRVQESSGQAMVFQLLFGFAEAETAGVFQCFHSTSMNTAIPNCQTLLIVLRKAKRPTILAGIPRLGKPLHLVCNAESATLPPDHGLPPLIKWHTNKDDSLIHIDEHHKVHIDQLAVIHVGMSFSCSFTDWANMTSPASDESFAYIIKIDGLAPTSPPTLAVLENDNVTISLRVLKTDEVLGMHQIMIGLDRHDGGNISDLAFIYPAHRFTVTRNPVFASRVEVEKIDEASGHAIRLELTIAKAVADLAGTYRCYKGARSNVTVSLQDCNTLLVVLRKAMKPTIEVIQPVQLGATLHLFCNASSSSLPPDHGLAPLIMWNSSVQDSRMFPTHKGHLYFPYVSVRDRGRSFKCAFSDDANGTSPVSDDSDPYVIAFEDDEPEPAEPTMLTLQYVPVTEIVTETATSTPWTEPVDTTDSIVYVLLRVTEGAIIRKALGEVISLKCSAECEPPCSLYWSLRRSGQESFYPVPNSGDVNELTRGVRKNDMGTFCCTASNLYSSSFSRFRLQLAPPSKSGLVQGPGSPKDWPNGNPDRPPDVPKRTAYVTSRVLDGSVLRHTVGEVISIKCIAVCEPSCEVTWSRKRTDQKTSSFEPITGHVHRNELLLKVRQNESGIYSCTGTNPHSVVHSSFSLQVVTESDSWNHRPTIFTLLLTGVSLIWISRGQLFHSFYSY